MHRRLLILKRSSFVIYHKKDNYFHVKLNIRCLVTRSNNNNDNTIDHTNHHENNIDTIRSNNDADNNNIYNVHRIIKQRKNPTDNQIVSYHFKLPDNTSSSTTNRKHSPYNHNQQQHHHNYYKIEKMISNDLSLYQYIHHFYSKLWSYLLPKGYPYSIRDGYSIFIQFQMLSNILSAAGGVLSMQSLLYAIGSIVCI
jgi:hypothetical protein